MVMVDLWYNKAIMNKFVVALFIIIIALGTYAMIREPFPTLF